MEHSFGNSRPFSLGIEEELQLLHSESYELSSSYDEVVEAAGEDERIHPELLQSTVEVATGIAATVGEAVEDARDLRRRLREASAERDCVIVSAGTHPFSRYEHQSFAEGERYAEIAERLGWIAERALIFGLHVHVGLESPTQAIAVADALRTHLPELLALSANSPFWQGRDTGLASTRIKLFEAFPRSGLPPAFDSWEEYGKLIERGVAGNAFADYTFIWWDLRPHPRLGTLELRICDTQTRLESVAAIAALFQSLAATFAKRPERRALQPALLLAENKWRATRYGLDGTLIDLERDEERPAREAVLALVERAEPAARRLGCSAELQEVERLCERGGGADEQRRVLAAEGSLLAVAQWLAAETVAGL